MGTGLQGVKAPPQQKKPSRPGKPKKNEQNDEEEAKIEELSFDEIKLLEEEFKQLTQGKAAQDREEIKKKREEDELLGRERQVEEQVSLSDIETAFESKKGGLPEHLASLPADHPLRARFEQGFRRRPDGTWYKAVPISDDEKRRRAAEKSSPFLFWVPIIILLIALIAGLKMYNNALEEKRAEIIAIIKKKDLSFDDPVIMYKYRQIRTTNWLPDLERLLREIQNMPRNYDVFEDNPEEGSYVEYIERHNLPFDEMDAQEWYTRSIRKPHNR